MSEFLVGNKKFQTKNHTYVMGILNMTPDSFSDGGIHNQVDDVYYVFGKTTFLFEGCYICSRFIA